MNSSALSSSEGSPRSPLNSTHISRFASKYSDTNTALGQQMSAIFANLNSARDSRPTRVEECLSALMDTLFVHAEEIDGNEVLQGLLLHLVEQTFEKSIDKGCRSFQVVFDMKWKDQHDKRCRCLERLIGQALRCDGAESCGRISECIGEVLGENTLTTTDMLGHHMGSIADGLRNYSDAHRQAACAEILAKFVEVSASVIKRNPALLERLTSSLPPLTLLQMAVETEHQWNREAFINLLTNIIKNNCFDVTSQMASQIAEMVNGYIQSLTEERQLAGLLFIISSMAIAPKLAHASWNLPAICQFLVKRDWSGFAPETRALAACTTGKVCRVLFGNEEYYDDMCMRFIRFIHTGEEAVVVPALEVCNTFVESGRPLPRVGEYVEALRECIRRLPFIPSLFTVIETIRTRFGDAAVSPIHSMVDEYMQMDQDLVNFGKLNSLLHFMGKSAPLHRPDVLALRINIASSRPIPVILRSLPLLVTLDRTNQLDEAVELLFHVDVKVRHAAISSVVALCKVLIARTTEEMSGQNGAVAANQRLNSQVSRSVERLLDVAVADVVPEVRLNALRHFSEPFYSYLCLPDCLEALFMARNDSHRVVRDESLVLLCRLHPFHPAIVHPQLLRAQEYMLRDVDVQDSSISLATYRSDLLRMCADHGALLVPPKLIESVVLQRLSQQSFISKKFCMSVLGLIQSLLQHSGPEGHVDVDLFTEPLLSLINGNESSMLRAAALHALCAILTTFTPDISTSLEAYRCVARIIRCEAETEEVDSVTVAAMQVLSTLGAANPVKLRKVLRLLEQDAMEKEGESANTGSSQLKPKMRITPDVSERYPSVFVYYLLKALQHSVDSRQQVEVLMTVYTVVHDLPGNQRTVILSHLLPQLRALLEDSERVHLIEQVLRLLCELTSLLRLYKSLVPSTTGLEIMQSVQQFCTLPQASQMPFNANVVQMLDDLAKIIPAQEIQANRWAVEFIHQRLSQNKNDLDLVVRVVKSLESYLAVMHEKDLQLILPHVLQCMEPISDAVDESKMMEVNAACFEFLNLLFTKQPSLVRDCCAQIVHTIMWFVELSESKTDMEVGLNTLACLIEVVRGPGQRFVMLVERVATQKGYPAGYFESLVRSAATGLPASFPRHHMSALLPDQPLFVICQRAGLTLNDFDGEMRNTLRLRAEEYALLEVSHQGHQSVVTMRFTAGPSLKECFQLFLRKAMDPRSTFSRNVCVVNVEQAKEPRGTNYSHVFGILSKVPSAKSKKREQSWIAWLHTACVLLTRYSSRCYFESSARFVERNAEFSRDVFPFVAVSAISQMELADRQQLMDIFSRAVVMSPIDTKQVLFALAEFMEAERGEQKEKMVKRAQQTVFAVCRNSVEEKFGINYDLDPVNGVTVTKLAPNGLGAKAGVPLGGRLLAINGNPVHAVGDIRSLIDGLLRIELCILHVVEERQRQEPKYLMSIDALATVAFESQMHAKAIYFNEILFEQLCHSIGEKEVDRQDAVVRRILAVAERLIEFYRHLNFTMTASGFVKHLTRKFSENVIAPEQLGFDAIGTLEQLHWWSEALRRYESRMTNAEDGSLSIKSFVGALRCEEALGHISVTNELIQQHWANLSEQERIEVAPYRAKAAFSLGLWSIFDDLATDSRLVARFGMVEHCAALFRAGQFDQLLSYTESSREAMLESFSESFSESYSRSYDQLVELQHLTHFEELVSYRRSSPDRQEMLRQLWYRRMSHMSLKPNNLNTLLSINSLVLNPDEDLAAQVLAIRSLTKSQWYGMAQHLLKKLGLDAPTKTELLNRQPELIHAYTKFLYTTGKRIDAYHLLHEVLDDLDLGNRGADNGEQWGWCWLLLGEWTMCLFPDRGEEAIMELIRATELCPDNYAPFHSLGILHYDLSRDPNTPQEVQVEHHIQAVIALFRSVQLCTEHSNMQDILRILSIWFSHSTVPRLNEMMHVGMSNLPDHVWVDVIPQLIARIGITARSARAILADLLVRVGRRYPQALIYPLTVAEKSPDAVRRLMAERVLSSIRSINNQMVKEASLISNEMVRIAILWTETWHAAIQQAATQPESPQYILRVLSPLFVDLEQPITPNERTFEKTFGPTLKRAKLALQEKRADKAWVFLKQVYAQLGKMLGERRLSMNDVSPTLDSIRHSIVAVPGTFEHGKPLVTIEEFHSKVYVMSSKQKPRRLGLDASNGQAYRFLLKGHEDMRQDERVMQFMGLINTIFETDNASLAIGLAIPRYAVIPLTDNVGIIGWVENTETIYKMLEVYRQKSGVSIYEEVNLIMKRGGLRNIEEFQKLPKPHRRSLLSDTMDATPEDELRRIMWERNDTCEQWLGYRDAYGHSLATMSMVGYVLGLGDRHLNNLMLQDNGTVVHIDFGDCFEVAMHRSLYAEAVPFRLTRLLIAALGITQVDGVYRLTCELVMKNLRRHSENLLSILEAFIYDPLINWRLNVNDNDPTNTEATKSQSKGEHGGRASTSSKASFSHVLDDVQEPEEPAHMQLSKSFAKQHVHHLPHDPDEGNVGVMECTEEETKNQQGHVALARVHAKLTGQDFAITNTSFSFLHSSRRMEESHRGSSWGSSSSMFGGSPKDSGVPLLPTYLSLRALNGGVDCLDVPHQVNRLIQEATSLDNLAEAYLTGWAPFW